MSTIQEQRLALSQLAYFDFNWPDDKNKKISKLLVDHDLPNENNQSRPVLAALTDLENYRLVNYQSNTGTVFAGAAFQAPDPVDSNGDPILDENGNAKKGEIIFAFRGTEPTLFTDPRRALEDFESDLQIAMDTNLAGASQFEDTWDFYINTLNVVGSGNYDGYSFTCHSLGGGLAQYMVHQTNQAGHAITFNAVDNAQIALKLAVTDAMKRGQISQAVGIATLNALTEVQQAQYNNLADVFFGSYFVCYDYGMADLMTSIPNLVLTSPVPDRDAAFALSWFVSETGRDTLLKMGNTPDEISDPTLKGELATLEEFLTLENEGKQKTWMLRYGDKTIGAAWIDLIKNHGVEAPSIHLMIGDVSFRGKGIGKATMNAMIEYLTLNGNDTIYSRHLMSNDIVSSLNQSLGFVADGPSYVDENRLEWQNVKLLLKSYSS